MFNKLLVVCTGNICRSPIGEILLRQKLAGSGVECRSAGTHAMVGHSADANVIALMAERGYDASAHRAQQASLSLLNWADLILGLDQFHVEWLTQKAPHLRGRVFKLGRWNGNVDVEDPYRKSRQVFDETYTLIERYVGRWVGAIDSSRTEKELGG
jgi:protein-tyrosine phosphatase